MISFELIKAVTILKLTLEISNDNFKSLIHHKSGHIKAVQPVVFTNEQTVTTWIRTPVLPTADDKSFRSHNV